MSNPHFLFSFYSSPLNILRANTIIPHPLINQRVLGARAVIRHLDIIIHNVIIPPILAPPPLQFPNRDTAQIGRQPRQMLDAPARDTIPAHASIFVDRRAGIVRIFVHEDILRDRLAGALEHFPHLVVMLDKGLVLGDGAPLGDEPAHVVHFALAVVLVPETAALGVLRAVVFAHNLRAVVFPRAAALHLDPFGRGRQFAETFHERAAHDGGPAVGGLHDFDARVDGGADRFAQVGVLPEAADHEHCVDFFVGCGDLPAHKGDDFCHDGLEDFGDFRAGHSREVLAEGMWGNVMRLLPEFAAADTLRGVIC